VDNFAENYIRKKDKTFPFRVQPISSDLQMTMHETLVGPTRVVDYNDLFVRLLTLKSGLPESRFLPRLIPSLLTPRYSHTQPDGTEVYSLGGMSVSVPDGCVIDSSYGNVVNLGALEREAGLILPSGLRFPSSDLCLIRPKLGLSMDFSDSSSSPFNYSILNRFENKNGEPFM